MTEQTPSPAPLWQKLLLMVGGVAAAGVLATLLLLLFPGLLPGGDSSARRYAGTTIEARYYTSDGDMFFWLQGSLRPPPTNELLAAFTLSWDADSFRMPARPADQYPVAVLGDSFTEGANVALPYPDVLAAALNVPVRNYGYRSYGPLEMQQVGVEFLPREPRAWVLYSHFSGNDVYQAQWREEDLIRERTPFLLTPYLARKAAEQLAPPLAALNPDHRYDYPMPVIIGSQYYELALLDDYLWWQRAPQEGFAATQAYRTLGSVLDTIGAALPGTTCRAFVFIPSGAQLYYPYLVDGRRWLRPLAKRPTIVDADGRLELLPAPYTEAEEAAVLAALDDQRNAMRDLAAAHGWLFIDLLEPFKQRVAAGELLYYPYDTHWNQAGHTLAGQVVADFMRQTPGCPLPAS
ncbi:MAG: GDSL-type esterase/lipase family protein [Anaerolineae bacterium]|jgi:hypothetical protein|nr:GDSL-type esterase/lipase family protein [Anaerolineae bacterium]